MDSPAPLSPYDALGWMYDEWVSIVQEDIGHYANLAHRAQAEHINVQAHVVELGAGSGRITIPAAQTGVRLTAIDTSQALLERLQMRAEAAGLTDQIEIRGADALSALRAMPDNSVHAVLAPFRMLLHLTDRRDELAYEVARVLVPHGIFAFDLFHPSAEALVDGPEEWMERCSFEDLDDPTHMWTVYEHAHYDSDADTLVLDIRCDLHHRRKPLASPIRTVATQLQLVGASVDAWRSTIEDAGMTVGSVSGWFDGMPYELGDADSVWQVRKPAR